MREAEIEIIQSITKLFNEGLFLYDKTEEKLDVLLKEPFGFTTCAFRSHASLHDYIEKIKDNEKKNFYRLMLYINDYLSDKTQEKLQAIEITLKKYLERTTSSIKKSMGVAILPTKIANSQFMRKIYLLNDENISTLFLKYLPAPRASIFSGNTAPEIISRREKVAAEAIINVLKRNEEDFYTIENKLINIQRIFRARQRRRENLKRLPFVYKNLWQGPNFPEGMTPEYAQQLLIDANISYKPQCDTQLAERIVNMTKDLELFSTVRHLTSAFALENIFNDGLLGRRTLVQSYTLFKPAALAVNDIDHGDANVVCLGANDIDPKAKHGIELIFDVKKIAEKNPCIFYKQRDLGYNPGTVRKLKIGALDLCFSHTAHFSGQPSDVSFFALYDEKRIDAFSRIPKALLIADNLKEMHQILTLNFFRFIDRLVCENERESIHKKIIYDALAKLNDLQLADTLLQIGKQMTDTMEFNFYGAYRIDFTALLMIKKDEPAYTLDLPAFVEALKTGDIEELHEVIEKLPEIFNSYRFLDYLLSKTQNKTVILELGAQREKCLIPSWIEHRNTIQKHFVTR